MAQLGGQHLHHISEYKGKHLSIFMAGGALYFLVLEISWDMKCSISEHLGNFLDTWWLFLAFASATFGVEAGVLGQGIFGLGGIELALDPYDYDYIA